MPFGGFIEAFPPSFFVILHIVLFVSGASFAFYAFEANAKALGMAFSLFALAEVLYLTYHFDWTIYHFAHTLAEVIDGTAFGLVFVSARRHIFPIRSARSGAPRE